MTRREQRTVVHAAHDPETGAPMWDLEEHHVWQEWTDPRPPEVPADADKDLGYLDREGRQVVVFRRRVPPSISPCIALGCRRP